MLSQKQVSNLKDKPKEDTISNSSSSSHSRHCSPVSVTADHSLDPGGNLKQNLAAAMSTSTIGLVNAGSVSGSGVAASGRVHYHKSSAQQYNNTPVASQHKTAKYVPDRDNNNNSSGKPLFTHYSSYMPVSGVNRAVPPPSAQDPGQQNKRRNWNNNLNKKRQHQQGYSRGTSPITPVSSSTTLVCSAKEVIKPGHLNCDKNNNNNITNNLNSTSQTSINGSMAGPTVITLGKMSSPPPPIIKPVNPPPDTARRSPSTADQQQQQPPQKRQESSDTKRNVQHLSAGSKSTVPSRKDISDGSITAEQQAHAAATHYPNELLKIIRDNMDSKDNTNLWNLLNNIAGPLLVKNAQFPLLPQKGSPQSSTAASDGGGAEVGLKESAALLQAMERNFIQNNPGYELLANAIFSNGGLLPSYFSDPIISPFAPPPPITLAHNGHGAGGGANGAGHCADAYGNGKASTAQTVATGSPVHSTVGGSGNGNGNSNGYHHQVPQQQPHHLTYQRMPPGGGEGSNGGGGHHHQQRQHVGVYSAYANNNSHNGDMGYSNTPHPFIYNGQMYCPRPRNFWNFCINCKKSQFCQLHNNNYNSSASSYHTNSHGGMHYIPVPQNYYAPEYYHRPYYGHNNYSNGGGGYYHHHRDKRNNNGRRQYGNRQQNNCNKSPETAASTPSGSGPSSPKTTSPTGSQQGEASSTKGLSKSQEAKKAGDRRGANNNSNNNNSSGHGSKDSSTSSGKSSQYSTGKKRWQQRPPNQGYDSDTSSSRSNGADSHYMNRCNYGLLQNMKLWNTEAAVYKREQLLTGELGPHQLMSPTNHRFNSGPLLITVLEGQQGGSGGSGDVCDLTTTPPVIHEDEPDAESAYWSSIFPFAGGLDEGMDSVEDSTPADKYLANAHLMELVETPIELIEGPPVPMVGAGTSSPVNRETTLSQQVWNTFLTVQQTQTTYRKKLVIWKVLFACIKKVFPRLSVYLVGSTITGFGAETSDIDMCVVSSAEAELDPRFEAVRNLTDLKKFLSVSDAFEQFHLIQAKVPILRFRDTVDQIEVDLNYNNSVGIRNTHLLYCYSKLDWRVRPLVIVVKLWAKYHNINNAKNMTISSYSLALMVIHFLQCGVSPCVLPCLHTMYPGKFQSTADLSKIDMNEDLQDSFKSDNKLSLGDLLLRFLYYYSNFDFNNWVISVRTGSCLFVDECRFVRSPKNDPQQWKNLCIEEPFDFTNTARSVYDVEVFQKIKYVFVQSYQHLQQTLDLKSILNDKFINFPVHQYGYGQSGQQQQHRDHNNNNNNNNHHHNDNSYATAGSTP